MMTAMEKKQGGGGTGSGTLGLREGFTEKVILEQRPEGSDIPVDRAFWADAIACKDPGVGRCLACHLGER